MIENGRRGSERVWQWPLVSGHRIENFLPADSPQRIVAVAGPRECSGTPGSQSGQHGFLQTRKGALIWAIGCTVSREGDRTRRSQLVCAHKIPSMDMNMPLPHAELVVSHCWRPHIASTDLDERAAYLAVNNERYGIGTLRKDFPTAQQSIGRKRVVSVHNIERATVDLTSCDNGVSTDGHCKL